MESKPPSSNMESDPSSLHQRVARIIELIRPAVQADGGDIELVGVTDQAIAQVRFLGACVGCPSLEMTLQLGIERNLRKHVPEIAGVEAVD